MEVAVPEGRLRTPVDVQDGRDLSLLGGREHPAFDGNPIAGLEDERLRFADVEFLQGIIVEGRELPDAATCRVELRRRPVLHRGEDDPFRVDLERLDAPLSFYEHFRFLVPCVY